MAPPRSAAYISITARALCTTRVITVTQHRVNGVSQNDKKGWETKEGVRGGRIKRFVQVSLLSEGPYCPRGRSSLDADSRGYYISNQCYFHKQRWNSLYSEPLQATGLPPTTTTEKNTLKSLSLPADDQWLHRNAAHAIWRDVYLCHYLELFTLIITGTLKAQMGVSVRTTFTYLANVTADRNVKRLHI